MNLDQIQRAMFNAVRQPLAPGDHMRNKTLDGRALNDIAEQIIKPNERLTSFERLEIYNRQYWFRIISSMADDFGEKLPFRHVRRVKLAVAGNVLDGNRHFEKVAGLPDLRRGMACDG